MKTFSLGIFALAIAFTQVSFANVCKDQSKAGRHAKTVAESEKIAATAKPAQAPGKGTK